MLIDWNPPELGHDRMMFERFKSRPEGRQKLERRIIWNLFRHLEVHGFMPYKVHDGEERVKTPSAIEAMEAIVAVDDSLVLVRKGLAKPHSIVIVLGNGVDCISDHSYVEGDADGFRAAMDSFNPEDCE